MPQPPPAFGAGAIHRLGHHLRELVGDARCGVEGVARDAIAEGLTASGLRAAPLPGWRDEADARDAVDMVDVVVALGTIDGADADQAEQAVAALAAHAGTAIVFAATSLDRFPTWWDQLFERHGFVPVDELRARLWDDAEWDAAPLTTLVLYVREPLDPSAARIPRSAVHPGALVGAQRSVKDLRKLAARLDDPLADPADPADTIGRALDGGRAALEAAVAERESIRAEASAEAVRLGEAIAAADAERAVALELLAATQEEKERTTDAARRADAMAQALRTQLDDVTATLAAAPKRRRPPAVQLGANLLAGVGRRVERSGLAAAGRLGQHGGRAGSLATRAASAYRWAGGAWLEATREVFDTEFYVAQRPGLVASGVDPVVHYARRGWRQGLDPHPLFDTDWYLRRSPEALESGRSPLEHFLRIGWREGCDPHPLFDTDFYAQRYVDVVIAGINPLVHYLRHGWRENRDPHPLFETAFYRAMNPDVEARALNPLVHYVRYGWLEGRRPGHIFDAEWYIGEHPEVLGSGLPPYRFFLEVGVLRGDQPSAWAQELGEPTSA